MVTISDVCSCRQALLVSPLPQILSPWPLRSRSSSCQLPSSRPHVRESLSLRTSLASFCPRCSKQNCWILQNMGKWNAIDRNHRTLLENISSALYYRVLHALSDLMEVSFMTFHERVESSIFYMQHFFSSLWNSCLQSGGPEIYGFSTCSKPRSLECLYWKNKLECSIQPAWTFWKS